MTTSPTGMVPRLAVTSELCAARGMNREVGGPRPPESRERAAAVGLVLVSVWVEVGVSRTVWSSAVRCDGSSGSGLTGHRNSKLASFRGRGAPRRLRVSSVAGAVSIRRLRVSGFLALSDSAHMLPFATVGQAVIRRAGDWIGVQGAGAGRAGGGRRCVLTTMDRIQERRPR
jgi:hypothetical protein